MQNIFLPKIEYFTNNINYLEQGNKDVQEVVKDLDKNLSLKLNKSALVTLELKQNAKFFTREENEELES